MPALHVVRPQGVRLVHPALIEFLGLFQARAVLQSSSAELGSEQVASLLADVALGARELYEAGKTGCSVPIDLGRESWELGLRADGTDLLVSLFRQGPIAEVAVFRTRIAQAAFRDGMRRCMAMVLEAESKAPASVEAAVALARRAVDGVEGHRAPRPVVMRDVEAEGDGLALSASITLDVPTPARPVQSLIERADLHVLLGVGRVCLRVGSKSILCPAAQIFLDAERLLTLAHEAQDASEMRALTFRRIQLSQARVTLRTLHREPPEGHLDAPAGSGQATPGAMIEVRVLGVGSESAPVALAHVSASAFVETVVAFCLALGDVLLDNDPAQVHNLRLSNFLRDGRALRERLGRREAEGALCNPDPESYRRFVPRLRRTRGVWDSGGRMRFAARWVATMPAIDLAATFLCGDHLMVGGAHETACLERRSGTVLWKRPLRPAASVVTPAGLVRIEPDGILTSHDLLTGQPRFVQQVAPRGSGRASGSAIFGAGLPRLLALTEGDRQVSAIDLGSGEVRWRYTSRHEGNFRLRRSGRLLFVAGGAPVIVALDAVSGEVVWRITGSAPFLGELAVDRDSAYALSGSGGDFEVLQLDPFTGRTGWRVQLPERALTARGPLLTPKAVVVITCEDEGLGAVAFDRATGRVLWEQVPGLVARETAFLAVDDCIIANSAAGVLLGVDAGNGHVRYNHVFGSATEGDQPRRLEPVLRNGALFVPQCQVHVVRPRDGELLGTLPSDLVPDLVRVDENCHVYVAEESGHLAAFGAAPRLALVS